MQWPAELPRSLLSWGAQLSGERGQSVQEVEAGDGGEGLLELITGVSVLLARLCF